MKEAMAFYDLIVWYNRLVLESAEVTNILNVDDIRPTFGFLTEELKYDRMYDSHGVISKIRCMADAVTAGVKETDFEKKWEVQREDLRKLFYRIESCRNEPNRIEEAK